jgi:hypothetical protein
VLGPGYKANWSPDGTHIVYARHGKTAAGDTVWIMDADGRNPHRIMKGARDPAWRPVGGISAVATTQFGMYSNTPPGGATGDTASNWKATRDAYMTPDVVWRREFFSGLPRSYKQGDPALGIKTFLSFKSSYADIQSGAAKAAIQAFAKTWPPGCYATWQHEPENRRKPFAADPYNRFVLPFEKVYQWVKAVRPDVHFGPVYMAFQWGPSGKAAAVASRWEVPAAYADFYGVDWYSFGFTPPTWNLATAPDFQTWFRDFSPFGKPVWLSEFGIASTSSHGGGKTDDQTVSIINASRRWVTAHPQVAGVMYWNGYRSDNGAHDIQITPTASRPVGRPKSLAAWNAWTTGR